MTITTQPLAFDTADASHPLTARFDLPDGVPVQIATGVLLHLVNFADSGHTTNMEVGPTADGPFMPMSGPSGPVVLNPGEAVQVRLREGIFVMAKYAPIVARALDSAS